MFRRALNGKRTMGTLTRFDIGVYDCDVFFETGTGTGTSLAYALESGSFNKLFSVEVHKGTAERAASRFRSHTNVKIINSDSISALRACLPEVTRESRILFFLDAHFPGEVDRSFAGYKSAVPTKMKLPLPEELEVIAEIRPTSRDVIIIDDLRIYEDGPFEAGNMPDWAETLDTREKNIDFVRRIFPKRHVRKYYWNQGYVLVSSKRRLRLRLRKSERPMWQLKTRVTRKMRKLLHRGSSL